MHKSKLQKIWKLLIDKDMTKSALGQQIGIATSTFHKMNNNEYVSLDVLVRICKVLNCGLDDIVELEFYKYDYYKVKYCDVSLLIIQNYQ